MLKDLNMNFIKTCNIVVNDLLKEWECYNGKVVPNLIGDLYRISISCKFFIILYDHYSIFKNNNTPKAYASLQFFIEVQK